MSVLVRPVRVEEGPLLRQLRLAALLESPTAFARRYEDEVTYPSSFWAERARAQAAGESSAGFFALRDATPCGLVAAVDEGERVGLFSMWVAPEARGRGAGRALALAVCAWAEERRPELYLWVLEGNAAALATYGAVGFVATGERQASVHEGLHELRMVRTRR